MWIVCLADDSHEIARRVFFEKLKKKKKKFKMSSAAVVIGALRVNKPVLLSVNVYKSDGQVAHGVDPDKRSHSMAADLGRYCLLRHVCPNT